MITLFGDLESGNVHKVQMILARLEMPFTRVDVRQTRADQRRPEFLAINPIGKAPVVILDGGDVLTESGAILFWFARDTTLWPRLPRDQTEVLRWMFFEQYSHEPALAVLRYHRLFAGRKDGARPRVAELTARAEHALWAMDARLANRGWIATDACTIADYALYPYTAWAGEASVSLEPYPAVRSWLARVESEPRFLPPRRDGAVTTIEFEEYVRTSRESPIGPQP